MPVGERLAGLAEDTLQLVQDMGGEAELGRLMSWWKALPDVAALPLAACL